MGLFDMFKGKSADKELLSNGIADYYLSRQRSFRIILFDIIIYLFRPCPDILTVVPEEMNP